MGRMALEGMLEQASEDQALRWHLSSNHFPPLPESLIPVAKRAIQAARRGQWSMKITLPEEFTWKGQSTAPVSACITEWHLDAFISEEEV